jgi:hypothetical protein
VKERIYAPVQSNIIPQMQRLTRRGPLKLLCVVLHRYMAWNVALAPAARPLCLLLAMFGRTNHDKLQPHHMCTY